MRVAVNQKHLSLSEKLAKEANKLAIRFNSEDYSKIENIDSILLKRDISVEKKKSILIKKLHGAIIKTFSINKKRFNKKAFESLKKRLYNIRKIINKLRNINYYLETIFLEGLKHSKIRMAKKSLNIKQKNTLARNELEAMEYTAYKLIEEAVMLDKKLLSEYVQKEKNMVKKERIEADDIDSILKKESELLEHLEAKLPPPKSATIAMIKEPLFTHWTARVFAILSYLEHLYYKEVEILSKLKKSKSTKIRISRKIAYIIKEKSKLLEIMEEKFSSMKKFRMDNKLKKELHNLATIIKL